MAPNPSVQMNSDEESTISPPSKAGSAPDVSEILQMAPAMIYTYNVNHADGTSAFPFVSEYCETIYGFTADFLMAHPEQLMNSVHEDDQQRFTKSVVDSMTNMTVWDFQFRARDKEGNVKFLHGKSRPRRVERVNDDGTTDSLTEWSGVVFDLTAHEERNQGARNEIRKLINNSLAPIFGIDQTGVIYKWNRVMVEVTGFTEEEAIGQPLDSFMAENERNDMTMLLGNVIRSGVAPMGQECCLVTKEGKNLHLFVKCSTRHDSNGDCIGIAFVGQDITKVKEEEKKKEAALKLVDAEKGLTEWLSHEVRNPLSVATEAAEALKDDAFYKEPESASHIDLISQSLRYIVELLTDMLDLNKCIEGKIALRSKPCNIREEILIPTRDMMNVRNKKVQVSVEGEEMTATVDSLRLRQVVTNLISNSLKFTTVGFIRITLSKKKSATDDDIGETMVLAVSDSGCGIDPAHHDVLFAKWEQLGSSTNGTGIGLCLCQSLIRVMGGQISLNKEYFSGIVGHPGTEFVIELPINSILHRDDRQRSPSITTFDAVSRAVVAAKTAGENSGGSAVKKKELTRQETPTEDCYCVKGKYHILIVDDDKVGRKFIRRRFQRLFPDAEIEEAVSGEEAVIKAQESKEAHDIITMDQYMGIGDMTGTETIEKLRENKVDAFIIGISGNAKQVEYLEAGAEGFWQKPLPSDQTILDSLITHLSPPSGWRVLTVDDVKMNNHFMGRKLRKVSSPHFTDMSVAEQRWNITSATAGEAAMDYLRVEAFDLVILDHQLGDGVTGADVARFVREHAVNKDAIVVLNSGSVMNRPDIGVETGSPFNLFWPKPLPGADQMRMNLCCELLSKQTPVSEAQ